MGKLTLIGEERLKEIMAELGMLRTQLAVAKEALEEIGTFIAREALAKLDGKETGPKDPPPNSNTPPGAKL